MFRRAKMALQKLEAKQERVKKVKSTFLKDPAESIMAHLGKMVDRATVEDVMNLSIYGALAYIGLELNKWQDWRAALIPPVALKLALTDGLLSQGAGLAVLAACGLLHAGLLDIPESRKELVAKLISSGNPFPFATSQVWAP